MGIDRGRRADHSRPTGTRAVSGLGFRGLGVEGFRGWVSGFRGLGFRGLGI